MNLGYRTVLHYLRLLWPFGPKYDAAMFRENYVPEGLPPLLEEARDRAHFAGQCTVCGACDAECPLLAEPSGDARFAGPMSYVVSGARQSPTLVHIEAELEVLTGSTCARCRACVAACPEDIPILALASDHRAQLAVIRGQ